MERYELLACNLHDILRIETSKWLLILARSDVLSLAICNKGFFSLLSPIISQQYPFHIPFVVSQQDPFNFWYYRPVKKYFRPTITFPDYTTGNVVKSSKVPVIGTSDFAFHVEITPSEPPEQNLPIIFAKDKCDDWDQCRLEWHEDMRIALYGLDIPDRSGYAWPSPDNVGWSSWFVSPEPIPLGKPTSITVVRNGTKISLYINNAFAFAITINPGPNSLKKIYNLRNTYPILIGSRLAQTWKEGSSNREERFWKGEIKNAKFWLHALPEAQIKIL